MALTIESGEYRAVIVPEGAGLASLTFQGRDLVVPHDPDVVPEGFSGKVLVPWPNRVAGATYEWAGNRCTLEVNEAETGSALHGLRALSTWNAGHRSASAAILTTTIEPSAGYPFALEVEASYALGPGGLDIAVTARNVGEQAAPYGVSIHPYLTAGAVDDCVLTIPAATVLDVDQNLIPVAEVPVADLDLDFREPSAMRGRSVDHAFGSLPDGQWTVALSNPGTGAAVEMTAGQRWVQAYSGEKLGRAGVALEPMSCPPDAFNTGVDVIVLQPGQSHTFHARIADASQS